MNDAAQANRQLIRDLFAKVINARAAMLADRYYRDDYIQHNPNVGQGLAGVKQLLGILFEAFPDLHAEVVHELAEGDRVMVLVEWRGTHLGGFAGLPPTGRGVGFRSADLFRIESGLIAEHWDVVDNTQMQLAMGLLRPA